MKDRSDGEIMLTGNEINGGDGGIRTPDPHVANVMLSQLSYIPTPYPANFYVSRNLFITCFSSVKSALLTI